MSSSKKRYKVIYERLNCIGATSCVTVYPERWVLNKDDDKADLIGGTLEDHKTQTWTLEITEEEFEKLKESAEVCPVNIIHIIDLETGKRVL